MPDPLDYDAAAADLARDRQDEQPANPYLEAAAQVSGARRTILKSSLGMTKGVNPDNRAKAMALAKAANLPVHMVEADLEGTAHAVRTKLDLDIMRERHPDVADWLSHPDRAAIASDDLQSLRQLDVAARSLRGEDPTGILPPGYLFDGDRIIRPIGDGSQAEVFDDLQELGKHLEARKDRSDWAEWNREIQAQELKDRWGPLAVAGGAAEARVTSTMQLFNSVAGTRERSEYMQRQEAESYQASVTLDPSIWGDFQRGLGGLAADVPLMLTGGPVLKGIMAVTRIGRAEAALSSLLKAKVSPFMAGAQQKARDLAVKELSAARAAAPLKGRLATAARVAAVSQPLAIREGALEYQEHGAVDGALAWLTESAIPGAFGRTGVERALIPGASDVAAQGRRGAAKKVFADAGLEGTEEVVTEWAHAVREVATGADPTALDPDKLWRRLTVAGAVGGFAGGAFSLPTSIAEKFVQDGEEARRASVHAERLDRMVDILAESKTNTRAPAEVAALMETTLGQAGAHTFVDADAFRATFDDPVAAATALGVSEEYTAALATGGQVQIPTATLLQRAATDEQVRKLIPQSRRAPTARSATEAEEFQARVPDALAQLQSEAKAQAAAGQADPLAVERAEFEADLYQQLDAASQPGIDRGALRAEAKVTAAGIANLARKGGKTIAQMMKLQVRGEFARALKGEKFDKFDAMIEKVRKSEVPTEDDITGKPLTKFLAERKITQEAMQKMIGAFEASQGEGAGKESRFDALDAIRAVGGMRGIDEKSGGEYDGWRRLPKWAQGYAAARKRKISDAEMAKGVAGRDLDLKAGLAIDEIAVAVLDQFGVGDGTVATLDTLMEQAVAEREANQGQDPAAESSSADLAKAIKQTERATKLALDAGYIDDFDSASLIAKLKDEIAQKTVSLPNKVGGESLRETRESLDLLADSMRAAGADVSMSNKEIRRLLSEYEGRQTEKEQPAFHGTPHKFDTFTTDHMGSGEGAQAYGWGLYFSGSKEVARYYRDTLSYGVAVDGKPLSSVLFAEIPNLGELTAKDTWYSEGRLRKIRDDISAKAQDMAAFGNPAEFYGQASKEVAGLLRANDTEWETAIADWMDKNASRIESDGRLYAVEIPEDGEYLLWDKTLAEQSDKVRAAIASVYPDADPASDDYDANELGQSIYTRIASQGKPPLGDRMASDKAASGPERASKALLAAGIKGIKYLDGNSRGQGAGSFNYVIFDGADVAITEFGQGPKPDRASEEDGQQTIAWEAPHVPPGTPAGGDPRVVEFFALHQSIALLPGDSLSVIAKDYVEARFPAFSPTGARVGTPVDAAALFAVLRSPFVERLSWMLVDEDAQVSVAGGLHSVGDQTGTDSFATASSWRSVKLAIDQHAGKKLRLYVSHNHPSGDPTPSPADGVVYTSAAAAAQRDGVAFTGLVLNGDRFSRMDALPGAGGLRSTETVPYQVSSPWRLSNPEAAPKIANVEAAADAARLIRHSPDSTLVIWLNAKSFVSGITTTPGMPSYDAMDSGLASQAAEKFILVLGRNVEAPNLAAYLAGMPKGLQDIISFSDHGEIQSARSIMSFGWSAYLGRSRAGVASEQEDAYDPSHGTVDTIQRAPGAGGQSQQDRAIEGAGLSRQPETKEAGGRVTAPKSGRLDLEAMLKQFRKATGDRAPVGGDAAWAQLEEDSAKAEGKELGQKVRNLAVQHNLTAENLLHADKLGGLAAPSLAVARKEHPLTGFGEITLLAPSSILESDKARTFDADIYSPRYPTIVTTANRTELRKAWKKLNKASVDLGHVLSSELDDSDIEKNGIAAFYDSHAAKLTYLREQGIDLTLPKKKPRTDWLVRNPDLVPLVREIASNDLSPETPAKFRKAYDDAVDKLMEQYKAAGVDNIDEMRADFYQEDGSPVYHHTSEMVEELHLRDKPGVDRPAAERDIRAETEKDIEKFQAWARENFSKVLGDEKILVHSETSWNARKIPHNLTNVVKILTAKIRDGEGFSYGIGNLRAKVAKQFRTVKAIQKDRDRIISTEQMDAVKEEVNEELHAIADEAGAGNLGGMDSLIENMKETAERGTGVLSRYYPDMTDGTKQRIADFIQKLKGLPTEYFETKVGRAVDLSEFTAAVVPEGVDPKAVKILKDKGLKVTTYKKGDDKSRSDAIARASEESDILFQPGKTEKRRASIQFTPGEGLGRKFTINLFRTADASSFLHESGHLFLELFGDLAAAPDATDSIKSEYAAIRKWLGAADGAEITEAQHEQFARGYERYLMEGVAPAAHLRRAFARIKDWMVAIYRSVANLNVELTPEIRGVFDRLLAAEDGTVEVEREHGMDVPLPREAFGSDAEFAAAAAAFEDSRQSTADRLAGDLLADLTEDRRQKLAAERVEVRADVAEQVDKRPVYQVIAMLQRGELPDGTTLPDEMRGVKLDRASLVETWGEAVLKKLPGPGRKANGGPYVYANENGQPVEQIARAWGFPSGDAMIEAMIAAPDRDTTIGAETDAEMKRRHPDPMADLPDRARNALATDQRSELFRRELAALGKRAGQTPAPIEVLRQVARDRIAKEVAYKLAPDKHRIAAAKAARRVVDAVSRQQWDEAYRAKVQEALALELYRASRDAKEVSEAGRTYIKSFNSLEKRARIGKAAGGQWQVFDADGMPILDEDGERDFGTQVEARKAWEQMPPGSTYRQTNGYMEQIDTVMDRFDLRRMSNLASRRKEAFRKWVERQDRELIDINPTVLEDLGTRNWNELKVKEQREIVDAVRNIEHVATFKNKLLKNRRQRDIETARDEIGATLAKSQPNLLPDGSFDGVPQKLGNWVGWVIDAHKKDSFIARAMDGDVDGGVIHGYLIQDRNTAAGEQETRSAEAIDAMEKMYKEWGKKGGAFLADIPGTRLRMTLEQRIGLASNWGNPQGRQRVMAYLERGKWKLADAQAVLDSLDAADWKLVNARWAYIDSFWSDALALEMRTKGVPLERVSPLPFVTKHGTQRGGYYPIKYDAEKSKDAADLKSMAEARDQARAANVNAQTRRSHTQLRSEKVDKLALRFDFDVAHEHLSEVIHDLTHRELIIDQNRLLNDKEIAAHITARYGRRTLKHLADTAQAIAIGDAPARFAIERFFKFFRINNSAATFGMNLTSALVNVTGFLPALTRVGPGYMAQGVARLFGSDINSGFAFAAGKSDLLRNRSRTMMREMADATRQVQPGSAVAKIRQFGWWPMIQVQRVVDTAVWIGAYEQSLAKSAQKGMSGAEADALAVSTADQTIVDTQGSGRIGDLTGMERGGEFAKLWTTFYTYFGVMANLQGSAIGKVYRDPANAGKWMRLVTDTALIWTLPALFASLIKSVLQGDEREDEEWYKSLAREQVSYGMGMLIGLREASGLVEGHFGYSGPAGTRGVAAVAKGVGEVFDGDFGKGDLKALSSSVGVFTGLPAVQMNRVIDAIFEDHAKGRDAEAVRRALFGAPRK